MNHQLIKLFALLFVALFASCKEEQLVASGEGQQYVLPQGNHDFDKSIVDFYKKYNSFILYKFSKSDFEWNYTINIEFSGVPADEKYVAQSLDFLNKELFGYYDERILQSFMPYKVLLCKEIKQLVSEDGHRRKIDSIVDVAWSLSHIAFGDAGPQWDHYSEKQKLEAKGRMHGAFWTGAAVRKQFDLAPGFLRGIYYGDVDITDFRSYGLFLYSRSPYDDLYEYVSRITSHTKAEMESLYFNPEFDPQGIYREKYEALIAFYKANYKIDLQAIGDAKLH